VTRPTLYDGVVLGVLALLRALCAGEDVVAGVVLLWARLVVKAGAVDQLLVGDPHRHRVGLLLHLVMSDTPLPSGNNRTPRPRSQVDRGWPLKRLRRSGRGEFWFVLLLALAARLAQALARRSWSS
jgi:hypothetical protein